MARHIYAPRPKELEQLESVEAKTDALVSAARGKGGMLDSTSGEAIDTIKQSVSNAKELLPARMAQILDKIEGANDKAFAVSCMLDGISRFERRNGFAPSADLIDAVLSQAENIADGKSAAVLPDGVTLDSVSSSNTSSATLAHQPNRIAVAITGGFSDACPFGAYLPADLNSNESKLAIMSAVAGSTFGEYALGDILDGTNSGRPYVRSERIVPAVVATDRLTATFVINARTGGAGVMVLRNRTAVIVDGFTVAQETTNNSGTTTSLISGQFISAGVTYVITGSVNVDTGSGSLAFTPALPAGMVVEAQGFIDFERAPTLIPFVNTVSQSFSLYCAASRVGMQVTPDSRTQTQSELGADNLTIAVQAARTQAANERYVDALAKVYKMAKRTAREYDFDASSNLPERGRASVWRDFASFMGQVDQFIANQTMEFGLKFLYVGAMGAAQFMSMDSTDFVPSGLPAIPGIFRLGTYKGKYDVYYTPYVVKETALDMEILGIGRSPQVARNPIVFADAVPLTLIPIAVGLDLKAGAALFSRSLTEVNPHLPSALGCALFTVKNVFA